MLLTLGMIQTGLWIHGHTVAERAASAAADVARGSRGSADRARDVAIGIARTGGLAEVSVLVTSSGGDVRVTVSGTAPLLLDLGLGRVVEFATVPLERVSRP